MLDNGIKMAFRLAIFDPGKFWRHGVDSGRLAKLDQLASRALIEANIVAFCRTERPFSVSGSLQSLQRNNAAIRNLSTVFLALKSMA
jgi:hypothetical protein